MHFQSLLGILRLEIHTKIQNAEILNDDKTYICSLERLLEDYSKWLCVAVTFHLISSKSKWRLTSSYVKEQRRDAVLKDIHCIFTICNFTMWKGQT